MRSSEPFPALLKWALLAPFIGFILLHGANFAIMLVAPGAAGEFLKGGFVLLIIVTGVAEAIAVPVALFLLIRDTGRYFSWLNVGLVVLATLPLVLLGAITLTLKFGHFHI